MFTHVQLVMIDPIFEKISISTSKFNKFSGGGSTEKGSGITVSYTSFTDKYGLRYSIDNESGKTTTRRLSLA